MHERPVAIVTGASSGIGLATSLALAARGWGVMMASRRAEALDEAADEVRERSARPESIVTRPTDMGEVEHVRRLIEQTVSTFGRLDGLVNNAGWARLLSIEDSTPEEVERAYRVNAMGPAWAIHFAWPHLAAQGGGRIVNVSTLGTKDPFPGFFIYAASKAGLNVMAASCDNEGRAQDVRAMSVAPGAVETPMLRSMFDEGALPGEACLTPRQVAGVIAGFLARERDEDAGRTHFVHAQDGEMVIEPG